MFKSCWIIAAVVAVHLFGTVKCQLDPEIVDEIIPEVTSQGGQAKLNCTVVNKQDAHTVCINNHYSSILRVKQSNKLS
ncbi:uncharacterized protein LOC132730581 isoform X2 [Ruditapes philippinarum]|uniref:uncharacterized protein LOC132730581 isoform X2 n=1 Tax=Ruditapes philippinarum TaxID=129788 RepID=UPI00295C3564|nr:uncharacterized protein LOC132730581 isoform X2 [Ruditapes philippinarum]